MTNAVLSPTVEHNNLAAYFITYSQEKGVHIVAVGYGNGVSKEELAKIGDDEVYKVADASALLGIADDLIQTICRKWSPIPGPLLEIGGEDLVNSVPISYPEPATSYGACSTKTKALERTNSWVILIGYLKCNTIQ